MLEEVGLDLTAQNSLAAGNLPERVVMTSWGKEAYGPLSYLLSPLTDRIPQPHGTLSLHLCPSIQDESTFGPPTE